MSSWQTDVEVRMTTSNGQSFNLILSCVRFNLKLLIVFVNIFLCSFINIIHSTWSMTDTKSKQVTSTANGFYIAYISTWYASVSNWLKNSTRTLAVVDARWLRQIFCKVQPGIRKSPDGVSQSVDWPFLKRMLSWLMVHFKVICTSFCTSCNNIAWMCLPWNVLGKEEQMAESAWMTTLCWRISSLFSTMSWWPG